MKRWHAEVTVRGTRYWSAPVVKVIEASSPQMAVKRAVQLARTRGQHVREIKVSLVYIETVKKPAEPTCQADGAYTP